MPHLDCTTTKILWIGGLALLFLIRQIRVSGTKTIFKIGSPTIKKFDNRDDVIKELDHLQEQIKSGQKVSVSIRKIDKNADRRNKSEETIISDPKEEIKVLGDLEEKVKQTNRFGWKMNIALKKDVREVSSKDLDNER